MVQEIWQKFNANERMAAIGAGIVVVAWIIGIASPYGIGASTVALLGAIALLAVLYLKYAPNQTPESSRASIVRFEDANGAVYAMGDLTSAWAPREGTAPSGPSAVISRKPRVSGASAATSPPNSSCVRRQQSSLVAHCGGRTIRDR